MAGLGLFSAFLFLGLKSAENRLLSVVVACSSASSSSSSSSSEVSSSESSSSAAVEAASLAGEVSSASAGVAVVVSATVSSWRGLRKPGLGGRFLEIKFGLGRLVGRLLDGDDADGDRAVVDVEVVLELV